MFWRIWLTTIHRLKLGMIKEPNPSRVKLEVQCYRSSAELLSDVLIQHGIGIGSPSTCFPWCHVICYKDEMKYRQRDLSFSDFTSDFQISWCLEDLGGVEPRGAQAQPPFSVIHLRGGLSWRARLTCWGTLSAWFGENIPLFLLTEGNKLLSLFCPVIEKSMPRIFKQQLKKQIIFVSLIYHFHNLKIGLFQLGHCIIMKHVRKVLRLYKYKEIKLLNLLIWTITTAHPHPLFG